MANVYNSASARMRPLNIGNVVTAGISLYRTNFQTYLGISTKALLWWLVPVYGWAKGVMLFGQIGRLGFQELIRQPETTSESYQFVEPKMWSFFGMAFLTFILQGGINFAISILTLIALIPIGLIAAVFGDVVGGIVALIGYLGVQIAGVFAQIWFQSRLLIYDLAIAVEPDIDDADSIGRSWQLTKGSVLRIQGVLVVTYLIMAPLFILASIPIMATFPTFVQVSESSTSDPALVGTIMLAFLFFMLLCLLASVVVMPLYQSIKAVLYYDLRSRREGVDLQLKDRA
jgi:hypothetical protein